MSNLFKSIRIIIILTLFVSIFSRFAGKAEAAATLSLSPNSGTFSANQTFDVTINLDTGGGRTAGTDVYLSFDKDKLNLTSVADGTIYDQYVGKDINNNTGRMTLSGIVDSASNLYSGSGVFATLKFTALQNGVAHVTFDYVPDSRRDSNVVDYDTQNELLTSVVNGAYTIGGTTDTGTGGGTTTTGGGTTGGGTGGGTADNKGGVFTNPSPTGLPSAGNTSHTLILITASVILLILGRLTFNFVK